MAARVADRGAQSTMRINVSVLGVMFAFFALAEEAMAMSNSPPADGPVKVEITERDGKFRLLRGGKPYVVRGAGLVHADLEYFAAQGGNSFRTWSVDGGPEPATQLLDHARALGLTVSLCLDIARERHGFDYDDEAAVQRQLEQVRAQVLQHRDHPALLTWIIGNELNQEYKNPKVFDAVNDISKMIHEIDPNHPTTTAISGAHKDVIVDVMERASDLDFISFQVYGDLPNLPRRVEDAGYEGPYFVTEWGATGHWEVLSTDWGAPVEHTSTEKAANYADGYRKALEPHGDRAIGNYVFLWGQKQERTPTWYGTFLETGEATEAVDVMYYIWNKRWPENRAPRVSPITLDGKVAFDNVTLIPGKDYKANIVAEDADSDPLTFHWEVRHESTATEVGGDQEEIPDVVEGLIADPGKHEITLTAPGEKGAYRLFVYVYDGKNHAGHANIPFYVQ